jgi:para-nitrobenzyl esterase
VQKLTWLSAVMICLLFVLPACNEEDPVEEGPVEEQALPLPEESMTIRPTESGRVDGFEEDNGSHAWLGIPYAKAPVGELRWKAPVPADPWEDTLAAVEISSICTQIGGPLGEVPRNQFGKPVGSEDCLYLNVWAPEFHPGAIPEGSDRLPVMVWIHGGGNSVGHGGMFSGKELASRYNLIVVSFNYRLGPLGWFAHPALRGEGTTEEERSGNFGTLDILHALAWVQENIAGFGGDPDNVTIFGQSAGALNVKTMLISPKSAGLFHKAIMQSDALLSYTLTESENYRDDIVPGEPYSSREVINQLLVLDGTALDRDAAKAHQESLDNTEIARYLRGKDNLDLLRVYEAFYGFGMIDMPLIVQDGSVVPRAAFMDLFRNGDYHKVPIILGCNRDEYKAFIMLDPEFVVQIRGNTVTVRDKSYYDLTNFYISSGWKASRVDDLAALLSDVQGESVYAYRFDYDHYPTLFFVMDLSFMIGAAHGMELNHVFNDFSKFADPRFTSFLFTQGNYADRMNVADAINAYWAEFAYSGSPGRGRDGTGVDWTAWDNASPDSNKFIIFDRAEAGGIRLSSNRIYLADFKQRLLDETGFTSQKQHCNTYRRMFLNSELWAVTDMWDDDEYENLGAEGCGDYPK